LRILWGEECAEAGVKGGEGMGCGLGVCEKEWVETGLKACCDGQGPKTKSAVRRC
jgi:hypothetical protein